MGGHDMSDREKRIRERAEQLWIEAGRPNGRDDEFWLAAEKEVFDADRQSDELAGGRGNPR